MQPKVSVIVPICNVEKYIRQALESLKNQTLKEIEIICVDDGSSDNSGKIADEFMREDARFRVIHKSNSGYGHTMNCGIKMASTNYIAVLESDDIASLDMMEKLYGAISKYDVDMVKADFYNYFGETGVFCKANILSNYSYGKITNIEIDKTIAFIPHCVWSGIYKKDFLLNNDIWFNETPGASYQDVGFMIKCWGIADKIVFIPDYVVYYRNDNPNSSVKSTKKVFCVCSEYDEVMQYFTKYEEKKGRIKDVFLGLLFRDYFATYNRMDNAFQYAFLIKMKQDIDRYVQKYGYEMILSSDSAHKELYELLMRGVELFYDKTSKQFISSFLLESYLKRFSTYFEVELDGHKDIYIYGAGKVGKKVLRYLESLGYLSRIKSFVTSKKDMSLKSVEGVPVFSIDEAKADKEALFLVSVKNQDQAEVIQLLRKQGYTEIISMNTQVREKLNCLYD